MAQEKEEAKKGEIVPAGHSVIKHSADLAEKLKEDRKQLSLTQYQHGWGMPADPQARKALAAIAAYYNLDPIMGDVQIMGGRTLYITMNGYFKKLEEASSNKYKGKPWRWIKRPANQEEIEQQGYAKRSDARVWYIELYPPEGEGEMMITSAFGEADTKNCQLQNIAKETGDPRILNRMAIKRAQHECARDVVTFRLPAASEFEKYMGMAMEEMLKSGINVFLEDGIMPGFSDQKTVSEGPQGAAALADKLTNGKKNNPPSETQEEKPLGDAAFNNETTEVQQAVGEPATNNPPATNSEPELPLETPAGCPF